MKTPFKKIALLLCLLLPLVAIGCDDDGDDNGTDTVMTDTSTGDTSTGDTTETDTAETDTTEADTAETDTTEADTTETDTTETDTTETDTMMSTGECTNASDLAVVQGDPDPADVAASCGQGCVNDADPKTCTVTCMKMDGNVPAISDACAGCYADSVVCTIEKCIGDCIVDPGSAACIQCREDEGCTPEFYDCSGLPRE